jgi:DNA-binding CsgD family transcriptional regulator
VTAAGPRARRAALAVGIVLAAALVVLGSTGRGGFATHPVGVLALVAAAVLAAPALAVSLLLYLASAVVAVATEHPIAVAVWNAMWLVPLALSQVTASSSVRRGRVWEHGLVLGTTGAAFVFTLFLVAPDDPFLGVPQIAPEAWLVTLTPIGDIVSIVGLLALLVLPIRLGRAALTSTGPARAQLGVAAAGTLCAPLTVVFCLLLAVARNPGAVDPSTGSVAFLVALAGCAAIASVCALLAARAVTPRALFLVVRLMALTVAVLVVAGVGTLLTAPAGGLGPTVAALAVAGLAVVLLGGAWVGADRVAEALDSGPRSAPPDAALPDATQPDATQPDAGLLDSGPLDGSAAHEGVGPALDPSPELGGRSEPVTPGPDRALDELRPPETAPLRAVPGLTRRENEVLELLASGASNAGIAAQLVVSERTVDAHLRAVFGKLELPQGPETNRRVQAARRWLDQG